MAANPKDKEKFLLWKQRLSESVRGFKHTPETCAKMAAAQKERWAKSPKRKKFETRKCKACGATFVADVKSQKRFCTIACFNSSPYRGIRGASPVVKKCANCGGSFKAPPNDERRRFCSVKCFTDYRFGHRQLNLPRIFVKGVRSESDKLRRGNEITYKSQFDHCQRCGWNEEPAVLHLHHKDRNRKNCSYENLEVLCPNCHCMEHYRADEWHFPPPPRKKVLSKNPSS